MHKFSKYHANLCRDVNYYIHLLMPERSDLYIPGYNNYIFLDDHIMEKCKNELNSLKDCIQDSFIFPINPVSDSNEGRFLCRGYGRDEVFMSEPMNNPIHIRNVKQFEQGSYSGY